MTPPLDAIPSLDLAQFVQGDAQAQQAFAQALGQAFSQYGFVAIRNHTLSDELVQALYEVFPRFFALPEAQKQQYEIPGLNGQRGYVGRGKEHAKGRSVGDLKEFFHIGQEIDPQDPHPPAYPANVFPEEIPEMRPVCQQAYRHLEQSGQIMLKALAMYLDLPPNYFEKKVWNGNSILRAIHYYPIEDPAQVAEEAVRAAEHTDINLITLLMGASAEGLEILRKDGAWIPVTALPEQLVVNVGDMLSRLTNDRLTSTVHRVVNPPREKMHLPRYSIPFFMHPRSEMDLSCLPNCVDAQHPKKYPDIKAGAFLEQRLAEIGLKK